RQHLELGERGRLAGPPGERVGVVGGMRRHECVVGESRGRYHAAVRQGMGRNVSIIAAAALGLVALSALPGATPGRAASASATAPRSDVSSQQREPRRRVPRITVVPLSNYYRKCDFWLAVEHRPSGDVITPQQHCWWALK